MDKLLIWGGERLDGDVEIGGCKNAVLPILVAACLADTPSTIRRVPWLRDVDTICLILEQMGVCIRRSFEADVVVDPHGLNSFEAPYDLVRKMRSSIYVLGMLLGRVGRAIVSHPGGCVIGPRPTDLHLKGLRALGATIECRHGYLVADAPELVGTEIFLSGPFGSSVGATINVLLAAVKAKGRTVIESAACEPDVVDVVRFLRQMGARIEGEGTSRLLIDGVAELHGAEYTVIADRIEAGTFMISAALTDGHVRLINAVPEHLQALIDKLLEVGAEVKTHNGVIEVTGRGQRRPTEITTHPYPGFPTDLQAQFMTLMAITQGTSHIVEKIYPDRFMHVSELVRLGANITVDGDRAIVHGVSHLSSAPVMASDLRASAALVLAGLVAEGETLVHRVYHIDRGYEDIEKKLAALGAKIKRIKSDEETRYPG